MISKKQLQKNIVAYIKVIEGPDRGLSTKLLYDITSIGRRQADIVFTDPKISGTHLIIEYRSDGKFFIIDQKSTNGTLLNNRPIQESQLSDGNILKLGSTSCIFTCTNIKDGTKVLSLHEATKAHGSIKVGIKKLVDEELKKLKTQKAKLEELKNIPRQNLTPSNIAIILEVIRGEDVGKKFEVAKGSIFIGRLDTDIMIRDTDVSRRHMLLETFGKDQIFVRDLASTNGTFVNDKKIVNAKVRHGDIITIGNTKLKLILTQK